MSEAWLQRLAKLTASILAQGAITAIMVDPVEACDSCLTAWDLDACAECKARSEARFKRACDDAVRQHVARN